MLGATVPAVGGLLAVELLDEAELDEASVFAAAPLPPLQPAMQHPIDHVKTATRTQTFNAMSLVPSNEWMNSASKRHEQQRFTVERLTRCARQPRYLLPADRKLCASTSRWICP